jgi:hypothetical protein
MIEETVCDHLASVKLGCAPERRGRPKRRRRREDAEGAANTALTPRLVHTLEKLRLERARADVRR